MTEQTVIDIGIQAVITAMKVSAPALFTVMITGLLISIVQAATQINEQTLSFVPKIMAMSLVLFITAPWIIQVMMNFTTNIIVMMGEVTK